MSGGGSSVSIPSNIKKTIQNIREITGNHSEEEIYALLKDCSMDPNETTQRLLFQDPFHEVKRKRDRRKEKMAEEKNRTTKERERADQAIQEKKVAEERVCQLEERLGALPLTQAELDEQITRAFEEGYSMAQNHVVMDCPPEWDLSLIRSWNRAAIEARIIKPPKDDGKESSSEKRTSAIGDDGDWW